MDAPQVVLGEPPGSGPGEMSPVEPPTSMRASDKPRRGDPVKWVPLARPVETPSRNPSGQNKVMEVQQKHCKAA